MLFRCFHMFLRCLDMLLGGFLSAFEMFWYAFEWFLFAFQMCWYAFEMFWWVTNYMIYMINWNECLFRIVKAWQPTNGLKCVWTCFEKCLFGRINTAKSQGVRWKSLEKAHFCWIYMGHSHICYSRFLNFKWKEAFHESRKIYRSAMGCLSCTASAAKDRP